ncbi:hypothetical protein PRIPAC_87745, partial [Pristionchus pacificus]|uniref:Uncharacterized protein n=1 Tax=Pristionchus pacificus TaxID=54126 RepID=A0A2A6CXG2_PRIPA
WFAPIFTGEAVVHTLFFTYEFLLKHVEEWLSDSFCNFFVRELHFMNSSMIFLYVRAIYYFLFQANQHKVDAFAFFIFFLFLILVLMGGQHEASVVNIRVQNTGRRLFISHALSPVREARECAT